MFHTKLPFNLAKPALLMSNFPEGRLVISTLPCCLKLFMVSNDFDSCLLKYEISQGGIMVTGTAPGSDSAGSNFSNDPGYVTPPLEHPLRKVTCKMGTAEMTFRWSH